MMTFVAACWTALLLLLAPGSVPGAAQHAHLSGAIEVGREPVLDRQSAPGHAHLRAPDALRVMGLGTTARRLLVRTATASAAPERGQSPAMTAAPAVFRTSPPQLTRATSRLTRAHAALAQGGVRPYFPTAPPVRG